MQKKSLVIVYNTFDEFVIDYMITHRIRKMLPVLNDYIFRGESSVGYTLLPSVLREENESILMNCSANIQCAQTDTPYATSEAWHIEKEYALLHRFFNYSNRQGLKLPYVKLFHHSSMMDSFSVAYLSRQTNPTQWYTSEMAELAALAQLYGCLTRLLDWTYDIWVAFYFAVHDALKLYRETGKWCSDYIRIWALDARTLRVINPQDMRSQLCTVVPSYHDNPNLRAQKGILTYWKLIEENGHMWSKAPIDRTPLDVLYLDSYPDNKVLFEQCPPIVQSHFPVSICLRAYQGLRELGYTSSRLFPRYQGVKKQIDDNVMIAELFGGRA